MKCLHLFMLNHYEVFAFLLSFCNIHLIPIFELNFKLDTVCETLNMFQFVLYADWTFLLWVKYLIETWVCLINRSVYILFCRPTQWQIQFVKLTNWQTYIKWSIHFLRGEKSIIWMTPLISETVDELINRKIVV